MRKFTGLNKKDIKIVEEKKQILSKLSGKLVELNKKNFNYELLMDSYLKKSIEDKIKIEQSQKLEREKLKNKLLYKNLQKRDLIKKDLILWERKLKVLKFLEKWM